MCVIPLSRDSVLEISQLLEVSGADWEIDVDDQGMVDVTSVDESTLAPPLLEELINRKTLALYCSPRLNGPSKRYGV